MKIALVQINPEWESKYANFEKARAFTKTASEMKCDVIVFPEMFSTGFSMNVAAIAEDGLAETASFLSGIAKEYSINLIAGFPIKTPMEEKGRNMAFVYDRKGKLNATYTKMHPFSFADEDKHYIAGEHVSVFDLDGIPVSVFICYDLRFPEVFRKVAKDVHAIFVLANWPSSRRDQWETLLKARAIENQCFVLGVNRTGTDGNGIIYAGASQVFGPSGVNICSGGEAEELTVCYFDPEEVNKTRSEFPFLEDMKHIV